MIAKIVHVNQRSLNKCVGSKPEAMNLGMNVLGREEVGRGIEGGWEEKELSFLDTHSRAIRH